jgi:hypothetical protein
MNAILLTPVVCTGATVGKQELAFGAVGQNRVKEVCWHYNTSLDEAIIGLLIQGEEVFCDDLWMADGEFAIFAHPRV